jgi:hypothetical protein
MNHVSCLLRRALCGVTGLPYFVTATICTETEITPSTATSEARERRPGRPASLPLAGQVDNGFRA